MLSCYQTSVLGKGSCLKLASTMRRRINTYHQYIEEINTNITDLKLINRYL